jgi:ABC-type Fe3+ transport system permease subunit
MNPPHLPVQKRFPCIIYCIVLALIVLVAFAPIASVAACSVIAKMYGCRVDEGSVHPCLIHGRDYGRLLYTLGVSGWFMLLTIPGGACAFVIWLIALILHRERRRKRFAVR